jgi:ParB family transcriptional regulator, chromosome partitioning protein
MTQTDQSTPVRRGLGRGLGSLIPTQPVTDPGTSGERPAEGLVGGLVEGPVDGLVDNVGAWFAEVPVDAIVPNPRQPRQVFDEEAMAELVHSVREVGLLQPVVVRPTGPASYELVMGERRWRACRQAGMTAVPAIVRQTQDDAMLRDGLLENLHRAQLNPLEEAAAYQQLLEDFGCTHEELAGRIGRSRPQISNTLRLLKLSPAVQRRVAAGVLSAGHARTLLAVPDADAQDRLATRVVAEGISVRSLEELVALGETGAAPGSAPSRSRRTTGPDPEAGVLAERLGDYLDTRVRIDVGRARSRITIECGSREDLERVLARIDGSLAPDAG